ncbi:lymphocyte antigen 6E-like [Dendropsophus ebraccatus]|uniref:lymphocyte antigen 6E-like n=1 Tax=Dendropsophus ebraccatus TaxID=150705 RepID=UPI003831C767
MADEGRHESASSLQCYTCKSQMSNTNCLTATNCSDGSAYCRTLVASAGVGALSAAVITKSCTVTCSPTSSGFGISSYSVSCCSSDLCNRSGGAAITCSYTAIILALGSVLRGSVL